MSLTSKIIVLGILDADNYFPILILLFLLARKDSAVRAFWFTVGIIGTQLAGGVIFAHFIREIQDVDIDWFDMVVVYGQILVGAVLVATAILVHRLAHQKLPDNFFQYRSGVLWVGIGVGVELTKLATSVVYLEAVYLVLRDLSGAVEQILMLGLFNLVAFTPLMGIWLLWAVIGRTHPQLLSQLQNWITVHETILIRIALAVVGLFLIVNGMNYR